MRNLKRALSLGLTAAMISGLMVMGSSAASYADVADTDNVEAIEVLQAVGIMVGDENGDFNPDQNVTRNEMAVVMSNLMEYNVASYKGTSPFTDVPSWAEPYVAACYTNGITAGTSATTYGGSETVTTAQAALMLMKALGYFQYASDFGSDWQLATTRQGNAIDLFVGVDSGVTQAMTRNDVAQLVLNTLEAGTVRASTEGTITVGGVTIANGVKYDFVTSAEDYAWAIDDATNTNNDGDMTSGRIVELGEQLYMGDLIKEEDQDKFGRPANIWEYNGQEIGTYADEATFTYTAKVNSKALYNDVGRSAAENYDWFVYKNGTRVTGYGVGDLASNRANDDDDFVAVEVGGDNYTGTGVLTQVYVDNLDKEVYVAIVDTYVGEVTDTDEDSVTIRQLRDTDGDQPSLDSRTFEMEDPNFEDGTIVLYTQAEGELMSVVAAESVSGTVNAYEVKDPTDEKDSYAEMDEERYLYSANMVKNLENDTDEYPSGIGDEYVFYLDTYGNLIAFEGVESIDDFLFVESAQNDVVGVRAYVTFPDGAQQVIDVDQVRGNGANPSYEDATTTGAYGTDGVVETNMVYTFAEDNGVYSLTALDAGLDNDEYTVLDTPVADNYFTNSITGSGAYAIKQGHSRIYPVTATVTGTDVTWNDQSANYRSYAVNSATVFVDVDDAEVYVSYDEVPTYGAVNAITIADQNGVAKLVFIYEQMDKSNAGIYVYIGSDSNHNYKDGNTIIRRYDDAYIGGEKVEGGLETRGLGVLHEDAIYEITAMNGKDQVTDVDLILDDASDNLISDAANAPAGIHKVLSTANHEIEVDGDIADFQNKSIFRWNDEETVFTTIETEYDRNGNVVVDRVKPGDISDINVTAQNAWVYIIDVDDASELTPTATEVFIVLRPDADDLATVSFDGSASTTYTVTGATSVVKGGDATFTISAEPGYAVISVKDADGNEMAPNAGTTNQYTIRNLERNTTVYVTTEVDNSVVLDIAAPVNAIINIDGQDYLNAVELDYNDGQAVRVNVTWASGVTAEQKVVKYGNDFLNPFSTSGSTDTYTIAVDSDKQLVVTTKATYALTLPANVTASWSADAANNIKAGTAAANTATQVPEGAVVTLTGTGLGNYYTLESSPVLTDADDFHAATDTITMTKAESVDAGYYEVTIGAVTLEAGTGVTIDGGSEMSATAAVSTVNTVYAKATSELDVVITLASDGAAVNNAGGVKVTVTADNATVAQDPLASAQLFADDATNGDDATVEVTISTISDDTTLTFELTNV